MPPCKRGDEAQVYMFEKSVSSAVIGGFVLVVVMIMGASFTVSAVQGEFGVMRRIQLNAEIEVLRAERDALQIELHAMENLTLRLSDDYLDLDLLDERARIVLGYLRADEVVIR